MPKPDAAGAGAIAAYSNIVDCTPLLGYSFCL